MPSFGQQIGTIPVCDLVRLCVRKYGQGGLSGPPAKGQPRQAAQDRLSSLLWRPGGNLGICAVCQSFFRRAAGNWQG